MNVKFNMTGLNFRYRKELHEDVKNFCDKNNITIDCVNDDGNYYKVGVRIEKSHMCEFVNYIGQIEEKFRQNKSFWWRLWN